MPGPEPEPPPYLIPPRFTLSPLEICFLEETLDDLQALDDLGRVDGTHKNDQA